MNRSRMMILSNNNVLIQKLCRAVDGIELSIEQHPCLNAKDALLNSKHELILLDAGGDVQAALLMTRAYRDCSGSANFLVFLACPTVADKVRLLDAGADEVMDQAFEDRELSARLRALLRRPRRSETKKLHLQSLELDTEKRVLRNGQSMVMLSPMECSLLGCLIANPDTLFSSLELAGRKLCPDESSDDAVRQRMRIVRRKLSAVGAHDLITTVPNAGYMVSSGSSSQ